MSELYMPGKKGEPKVTVAQAETKSLEYWSNRKKTDFNESSPYADSDRRLIAAIDAELARRNAGGAPQPAPAAKPATAMQRQGVQSMTVPGSVDEFISKAVGSHRKIDVLNDMFHWLSQNTHFLSPAVSVGNIPEGFAISIVRVNIDPREAKDGGEIYSTGMGKYGLGGSALEKIAAAAGISFDPELSLRVDDGSVSLVCGWRAAGTIKDFDGTERMLSKQVWLDMRGDINLGSPGEVDRPETWSKDIRAMKARANTDDGFRSQVRDTRLYMERHAETKAQYRVIRALVALKKGFTKEELQQKPFTSARLMWTGQSDDPVLRARAFEMHATVALAGKRALFGNGAMTAVQAPMAAPQLRPPPPQQASTARPFAQGPEEDEDDDDSPWRRDVIEHKPGSNPPPPNQPDSATGPQPEQQGQTTTPKEEPTRTETKPAEGWTPQHPRQQASLPITKEKI